MEAKANKKRQLTLIFFTLLIDVIGFGIIIPIMPKLLETLGDYNTAEAAAVGGWMVFAFALPQFLFSPIMGALSDKYGRRPILLLSLLGLGIDYIFHAFAPSIALLFLGRIIAGICGASFTTASSYIADISAPEEKAKNFGLIGVAFGLGFILGPILGGLTGSENVRIPFIIAACLSLINAALCYTSLPESLLKSNRREFSLKRANPIGTLLQMKNYDKVFKLMAPLFLLYLASHAVQSNWPYYTKFKFEWSEKMIGISLGVVGVMVAVVQGGLIRVIVPKLGNERSITYGFFLYFLGMLLFALANSSWMMFAFTSVYCLGGIAGPALQSEMSQSVPANAQGELSGGMTAIMSLTSIFGPLIMNNLFTYFADESRGTKIPEAPMLLGSLLIAAAWLIVRNIYRKQSKTVDKSFHDELESTMQT